MVILMIGITVDRDLCTRCGICSEICTTQIITLADNSTALPEIPSPKEAWCLSCGHCEAFCPTGALTREHKEGVHLQRAAAPGSVGPEKLGTYLKSRRSIRIYRPEPVANETLMQILENARYAATGGNYQPVEWVVVNGAEKVHTIAALTLDYLQESVKSDQPLTPLIPLLTEYWNNGIDILCRGAPVLICAHVPTGTADTTGLVQTDAIIALTHVDITAPAFGLGTCWAGRLVSVAQNYRPVREALHIPDNRKLAGALLAGYPKYKPVRIPERSKSLTVTWV